MLNRSRSTFVSGLGDMSAEAVVCSTFGIQPGIVKQAKEKFASDSESSSYNVLNKVVRSSRGSSANASLKSEYDIALHGDSAGKYSESGLVFRRPPLLGGESGLEKSYFSEGSIHNIREFNGGILRPSNAPPGTRDLEDHARGNPKRKEPNFRESLRSTQIISTNDSHVNAPSGYSHFNMNNGNRVFGTFEGQDSSLTGSPANGTFENLKADKVAHFRPDTSKSLGDELSKKHLPSTHIKHVPFSYIHPNEEPNRRGLIHQRYVATPFEVAQTPASDSTQFAGFRSSREMPTNLNKLFPLSAGTHYVNPEWTVQRPSREYSPVQHVQHNPALVNLSPRKPWDKWSGQGKPVAVGAEESDRYLNSDLQNSAQLPIKSQSREQRHIEEGQRLSRNSSSLISNLNANPAYAVSASTRIDEPQKIEHPRNGMLVNDVRKSVNNSQQSPSGGVQGQVARRSKSFVMHRSNTISLGKTDSYSERKREQSARVLETSRFPQTCWWTYPYHSNRYYRYPSQKDVHSDGYNERISGSNANEPKDTITPGKTMEEMSEHLAKPEKSRATRDTVPDKARLIEDENNLQPPKPLQAPSLRRHNAEEHAVGRSCPEKTLLNSVHNQNVPQLVAERKHPPSAILDDQKILPSRVEQRNTPQNYNTFEIVKSEMGKTYQEDTKTRILRQSNSLESQPRFLGLSPREWVPQSHSENHIRRPIHRSNSQPQAVAANKDLGLVEATTKKPSGEVLSGTIPKPPSLEIPNILDFPEHQKGELEHCDPLDINQTTKPRTMSMPSSNRNSCSSISQRPEYTVLAQKLEEQFRTVTSCIKPRVTTTPFSESKPKDRVPEPTIATPVVEKYESKAETASTTRPSNSWPLSGSSAGRTLQPMQRQLMMELAETLAKRTENVDPQQLSTSLPKTESSKTKQGNISLPTSPEVAAVSSETKPDKLFAVPKPFVPVNATSETNETAGTQDTMPNFRPGVTNNEPSAGMFSPSPFRPTNLVPMQNDKHVGNTNGMVGSRGGPPNFRPGGTTREPPVGMFNPVPFPSTKPVPAYNDKIEPESGHIETRGPVPVFTPPLKAPPMHVFGQISDSGQLTNSNVQQGPSHGDAKIPDSTSKELSKPTSRPRVLFPPDDKLTTTHDYEVDSRISSPSQTGSDFRGFVRSTDLRMYKSSIEDTSDTASNCSATVEPLRRSRKQYPRPRIQFNVPSPDIPEPRAVSVILGPKPYKLPPHFQRHKTAVLSDERSPSFERPNSAPATPHSAVKPTTPANLPKYPWKPYPLNP